MGQKITDNELLDRYLSGAITAPQEAELERRAQSDPVLADALAGVQGFPEADHSARVEAMLKRARPRVQEKVEEAKVRPIRRYAAVAAVLLLLTTAMFLLPTWLQDAAPVAMETEVTAPSPATSERVERETPSPPVAETDRAVTTEPAPPAASSPAASSPAASSPAASSPARDPRPRPATTTAPATATTAPVVAEAAPAPALEPATFEEVFPEVEEVVAEAPVIVAPIDNENRAQAQAQAQAAADRVVYQQRAREAQAQRMQLEQESTFSGGSANAGARPQKVTGYITDENGEPIIGALVRLPGLPIGERTDTNGVFTLDVDMATSRIEISHPDFEDESLEVSPKNREDIQLTLEAKEEDDEQWKQAWAPTKIPMGSGLPGYALPEEGYNALRKRIEAGKPDGVPAGKIKLSFIVDPDGTLSDFIFRGKPSQETMDYVGGVIAGTSIWKVVKGDEPVRVYFKVVFE